MQIPNNTPANGTARPNSAPSRDLSALFNLPPGFTPPDPDWQRDFRARTQAFLRRDRELFARRGRTEPTAPTAPAAPVDRRKSDGRVIGPDEAESAPLDGLYAWKGVIGPGDLVCLYGEPGAGKSTLATAIAYRVARGDWLFGRRTTAGPVLYVAMEATRTATRAVRVLRRAIGPAPGFGLVEGLTDLSTANSADHAWLMAEVQSRKPSLVVIDTLHAAFPAIDENSGSTVDGMGRAVAVMREVAEAGPAVMVLHHGSKQDQHRPRGHTSLAGALDVAIHVDGADSYSRIRHARIRKVRVGDAGHSMPFTIEAHELARDGDGDAIVGLYAARLVPSDSATETTVEAAPVATPHMVDGHKLTGPQAVFMRHLTDVETASQSAGYDGTVNRDQLKRLCVADAAFTSAQSDKSKESTFNSMIRRMAEKGLIGANEFTVWRIGRDA